jgi:hypothetical protein
MGEKLVAIPSGNAPRAFSFSNSASFSAVPRARFLE